MDSISVPISNVSAIGPNRDGNPDQGSPSSIAECLNELENELANVVPWTCPNRLKVVLGRIAMKVQKDKPTMGKIELVKIKRLRVSLIQSSEYKFKIQFLLFQRNAPIGLKYLLKYPFDQPF